jgi:hypothetical protein
VTVREAFEKAWGEMPEWDNETCHFTLEEEEENWHFLPMVFKDAFGKGVRVRNGEWEDDWYKYPGPLTPDISDRPASAFLGFFGEEYDRVVAEDQAAWRAALHGARVSVSDAEDDGA